MVAGVDSGFSSHWQGATSAGLLRGAYHFAKPDASSGSSQAHYFVSNGGNWTSDGKTLPGMLDMEPGTEEGSSTCYGLSSSGMVSWISDFVNTYHSLTSRYPVIYTGDWWETCTGGSSAFAENCPLLLASYGSSSVPTGWSSYTFWQYNDSYKYGGDSELFNGSEDRLKVLAKGS